MSTAVRVVLPGALREHVADGRDELRVEVGPAQTLGGLLDDIAGDHPRLGQRLRDETGALRRHVNLFIDGDDARGLGGLDAAVAPGAVVHVLPAVSGG